MIINKLILSVLLSFTINVISAQTAEDILPGDGWHEGWTKQNARSYAGDDLFFLINGGADLYMEYGFSDVAAAEYSHAEQGILYVEVYKMLSDSAAFGVFSMNSRADIIKIEPSPWLVYDNDFMHVWKGNYYITVSGSGLKNKGLRIEYFHILADIVEKIEDDGKVPGLFAEFNNEESLKSFSYLMGNIALGNIYSFGFKDIFKIKEALVIENDNCKKIIFQYKSDDEAIEIFSGVVDFVKESGRFNHFSQRSENLFSATDRNERPVIATLKEDRIIIEIR